MILSLLLSLVEPGHAARHIRVVQDISGSMQTEDPSRLALMSSALLRDLQRPDPVAGDTFSIFPFDARPQWIWQAGAEPPPCGTTPIRGDIPAQHPDFVRDLLAQGEYSGDHTWYTPCLTAALRDLEGVGGSPTDPRVVVLLTDGLPADDVRDPTERAALLNAEKERIRAAVAAGRLGGRRLDVYVLLVGRKARSDAADSALPWIRELAGQDAGGLPLARVVTAPRLEDLGDRMIEIYEQSFNYSHTEAECDSTACAADLALGEEPDAVAIIGFGATAEPTAAGARPLAAWAWRPPDRGWSSFGLSWINRPTRGVRSVISRAGAARVLVLRPRTWVIEAAGTQVRAVIAGRATPFAFSVRSATGTSAVSDMALRAYIRIPETPEGESFGPASAATFNATWPARGASPYQGGLRVEVYDPVRPDIALADARFDVTVYPSVELRWEFLGSDWLSADAGVRLGDGAIRDGGSEEIRVRLTGTESLPERVPLRVYLDPPEAQGGADAQAILATSTFRLVGGSLPTAVPLAYGNGIGPGRAGSGGELHDWHDTRRVTREEMAEGFTLSVDAIVDRSGGTVDIPMRALLQTPPYSTYPDLIPPLRVQLSIASPSWVDWAIPASLLALLLAWLLGLLVYGRAKPTMPPDFRLRTWRAGGTPGAARPLYPGSAIRALLARAPQHPLTLDENGEQLGALEPIDRELYRLTTASGFTVGGISAPLVADGAGYLLSAGATYRITCSSGDFYLWLGFEPPERALPPPSR